MTHTCENPVKKLGQVGQLEQSDQVQKVIIRVIMRLTWDRDLKSEVNFKAEILPTRVRNPCHVIHAMCHIWHMAAMCHVGF